MEKKIPASFNLPPAQTEAERLAQKAKEALSDLVDIYVIQARQDFQIMQDLLSQATSAPVDERFHLIRDEFFVKMHDLKGQGATFGYPLLTEIGAFACDFLRHKTEISSSDLDILKDTLSDMELVLKNNLTDSGGALGNDIRNHLKQRENG